MELDKLELVLRRRSPWQAMDLGIKVALRHYRAMLIIAFVMVVVVSLLSFSITQSAFYTSLILLWFKPAIERPLLHYLSRVIFSQPLTVRETLLAAPKLLSKQWLQTYTYRRLNPSRGFNDAVVVLEGLRGEQRTKRLDHLHNGDTGSTTITLFGFSLELTLETLLLLLPWLLLPASIMQWSWDAVFNLEAELFDYIGLFIYAGVVVLLAPFYMSCSFILYLNRRTHLEAWDIELSFKKLKQRFDQTKIASFMWGVVFMGLVGLSVITPSSWAVEIAAPQVETRAPQYEWKIEDPLDEIENPAQSVVDEALFDNQHSLHEKSLEIRSQLKSVLDSDTFGRHYQEDEFNFDFSKLWDWNWDWDSEKENSENTDLAWLESLTAIANAFKYIIIGLLSILLAYTLIKYRPWVWLSQFRQTPQEWKPTTVLGMDVTDSNLPDDVHAAISKLLEQEKIQEVLSLMFRVQVASAMDNSKVPFKAGHTERECIELIHEYCHQQQAQCFARLVGFWQQLVYAHQPLNTSDIRSLVRQWQDAMKLELSK